MRAQNDAQEKINRYYTELAQKNNMPTNHVVMYSLIPKDELKTTNAVFGAASSGAEPNKINWLEVFRFSIFR